MEHPVSTLALLPRDSFARAIRHQFIELLYLLDLAKQTFRKYHGQELLIVLTIIELSCTDWTVNDKKVNVKSIQL